MHLLIPLLTLTVLGLGGCAVETPSGTAGFYPLDNKKTFEEAQKRYTNNIRYGLFEDAMPFVEPELQPRFQQAMRDFRELRFSDYTVENVEIDPLRTKATAVVLYKGYWLSSPYERELRIVQRWRREVPTHDWYVTPDFERMLNPSDG
jgi:hypothetical protein